jgi:hypothetical protein
VAGADVVEALLAQPLAQPIEPDLAEVVEKWGQRRTHHL